VRGTLDPVSDVLLEVIVGEGVASELGAGELNVGDATDVEPAVGVVSGDVAPDDATDGDVIDGDGSEENVTVDPTGVVMLRNGCVAGGLGGAGRGRHGVCSVCRGVVCSVWLAGLGFPTV
jgi:hypothetical protein